MKRIVFTLALIMGFGLATSIASSNVTVDHDITRSVEGFTPIEVRSLPDEVQDVLAIEFAEFSVTAAEVGRTYNGEANYKVMLLNQENVEDVIVFSEKGEIVE